MSKLGNWNRNQEQQQREAKANAPPVRRLSPTELDALEARLRARDAGRPPPVPRNARYRNGL